MSVASIGLIEAGIAAFRAPSQGGLVSFALGIKSNSLFSWLGFKNLEVGLMSVVAANYPEGNGCGH
jgi:hypothetical protein